MAPQVNSQSSAEIKHLPNDIQAAKFPVRFFVELRKCEINLPNLLLGDDEIRGHSLITTVEQIYFTNCPETSEVSFFLRLFCNFLSSRLPKLLKIFSNFTMILLVNRFIDTKEAACCYLISSLCFARRKKLCNPSMVPRNFVLSYIYFVQSGYCVFEGNWD